MRNPFSAFSIQHSASKSGITLLLVVVLISALLSISLGIFNLSFGEIQLSGEIADSFVAFYAADQGIERLLYRDRTTGLASGYTETRDVASGACYTARITKGGEATEVVVSGQYRCGANPTRVVKRGFQVSY